MPGKHVTARVPEDVYEAIEAIREEEQTDRSTAIKRLLERGIEDWQLDATALLSFDAGFYGTYFPSLPVYPERDGPERT